MHNGRHHHHDNNGRRFHHNDKPSVHDFDHRFLDHFDFNHAPCDLDDCPHRVHDDHEPIQYVYYGAPGFEHIDDGPANGID